MRALLVIFLCSSAFISNATIEMQSVYFDKYASEPTEDSQVKLKKLMARIAENHFQLIEINSFSAIEGGTERNKELSTKRLQFVMDFLNLEPGYLTINSYGDQRIPINFEASSWNRVDIYYSTEPSFRIPAEDSAPSQPSDTTETLTIEESIQPLPIKEPNDADSLEAMSVAEFSDIPFDTPIVLRLEFKGGTNKIKSNSEVHLEHLFKTMNEHPTLHALLRGHVCCGNNKFMSKRRAKFVYKYLVERGISKDRLSYLGLSNNNPLVFPERTSIDRSTNRRVDVIFSQSK